MADGQSVGFRRIVLHDHAEILEHQKPWSLHAGRQQQECMIVRSREGLPAGALYAMALPLANTHGSRTVGQKKIESGWYHHLVAPGLTGVPAILF